MTTESTVTHALPDNNKTAQYVGFHLAKQVYMFPIGQIQEIVILKNVTRVPQVEDYVEGVSNLRGMIIPIISLRKLFGLQTVNDDDETRTIVVNVGARTMGCTVDSVAQVIRIPLAEIQPTPEIAGSKGTPWISGFAKVDDELHIVLDVEELLDPTKLDQVRETVRRMDLKTS